jgi:hypothetical protein
MVANDPGRKLRGDTTPLEKAVANEHQRSRALPAVGRIS